MENNNEPSTKESWSKPEVTHIGVADQTLGHGGAHHDGSSFS